MTASVYTSALPELVLFDLDGTLVDSVPDLAHSIDHMLLEMGLSPCGIDRVRHWVGNGADRLVKRALTGEMTAEPEIPLFERAIELFFQIYAENNAARSCLYPGVMDGLRYLSERNVNMACITNKPVRFTTPLLDELQLSGFFPLIVGGDTLPVKKPAPEPLHYAVNFFKVSPLNTLMVGDSVNDIRAARAAGIPVVCVPYGYNHGQDIRDHGPDAVIESLAELADIFEPVARGGNLK